MFSSYLSFLVLGLLSTWFFLIVLGGKVLRCRDPDNFSIEKILKRVRVGIQVCEMGCDYSHGQRWRALLLGIPIKLTDHGCMTTASRRFGLIVVVDSKFTTAWVLLNAQRWTWRARSGFARRHFCKFISHAVVIVVALGSNARIFPTRLLCWKTPLLLNLLCWFLLYSEHQL